MSTTMSNKPILSAAKFSNGGHMDLLSCNWNGAQGDQSFSRPTPVPDALSGLAQLITRIDHKPKPPPYMSSICKECGLIFSDLNSLARHHQSEHALEKLHRCHRCGHKFALLSTLHLHRCSGASPLCQVCRGKPQRGCPCPSCGAEPSGPHCTEDQPFYHDNSPYACAPCGRAFSHKQELLYHQQAGDCQPAPLSPKALTTPTGLLPVTPAATPTPSYTSLPPSPACANVSYCSCTLCHRTFRSPAGLASHMRGGHSLNRKRKKKNIDLTSGMSFPCRSCDKVFSQTSLLYLHRKEEHRREIMVRKPSSAKTNRQRKKGETYPCLHCGKLFLHHLTRWAHFRHYSAHHQAHLALSGKSKAAIGLKNSQEPKYLKTKHFKRGRPRIKRPPALQDSKEEKEVEEDEQSKDGEYPCASCEEVFSTRAALTVHENVHEAADMRRCCSVCAGGIPLTEIPEACEKKVYHCVPCAETFTALFVFLEHCRKHLYRDKAEDEDQLSDD